MKTPHATRRQFLLATGALVGAGYALPAAPAGAGLIDGPEASAKDVPLAPPDKQPANLKIGEEPAKRVGWAIVGLGELALGQILPAFRECRISRPVALVSGHPDKARKVAVKYGIEADALYDYDNFDRIIADPRIEVVYIVLPNSLHADFTIRALKAGKHVLCEKPMAVTVEEGEAMAAAARQADRKLAIAYRLHYEPMNRQAAAWCSEKKFGPVKIFSSSNCQQVKAPNIRLSSELGGGPVGDVGIYSINTARAMIGEEPVAVTAVAIHPKDDPRFREVPESVAFTLRYPSGAIAVCDCSFGVAENRRYRVQCTEGYIEMDPAFSYRGLRLRTHGTPANEGLPKNAEVEMEQVNHFAAEMEAFSKAVLGEAEIPTPAEMGIADLRIITAIGEAARSGETVKLKG